LESTAVRLRTGLFVALLLVIVLVQDGLPQVSSPLRMQVALLPFTFVFLVLGWLFLFGKESPRWLCWLGDPDVVLLLVFLLELAFVGLFLGETGHYAEFGYRLQLIPVTILLTGAVIGVGVVTRRWKKIRSAAVFGGLLAAYGAGQVLAIVSFPLNYLRSDMMSVILWADRALLSGANPYQHFHVADRIYDFPYLPGMILAFVPAQALHLDPRWAAIAYIAGATGLLYWAAAPAYRIYVAGLAGLFVLCPYLQYRHELYTQGHFFSLVLIFVLMQRGRFAWAAAAFGISMVISQFSWVIFPFFLMNALRRGGWREVGRMVLIASAVAGVLLWPFLASRAGSIAHNAVGQWDALDRPIARPINVSFWLSYIVRPVNLKWVQLLVLAGIFCFCWARGRCADLTDMLRWMVAALTVFILLNVLIDGYFYLMLLVPMLVYTCSANGWLRERTIPHPPQ
jgi:hypothetical protein